MIFLCLILPILEAMAGQAKCLTGPKGRTIGMSAQCLPFDLDKDGDVDLADVSVLLNDESWSRSGFARKRS